MSSSCVLRCWKDLRFNIRKKKLLGSPSKKNLEHHSNSTNISISQQKCQVQVSKRETHTPTLKLD